MKLSPSQPESQSLPGASEQCPVTRVSKPLKEDGRVGTDGQGSGKGEIIPEVSNFRLWEKKGANNNEKEW